MPEPELSSDIDWMLQSGQANLTMLAEVLSNEYYAQLYRLALSNLNDPEEAALAAKDTLSAAILNVHQYKGEMGVNVWLFGIALDGIRRISRRSVLHHRAASGEYSFQSPAGSPAPATGQDGRLYRAFGSLSEKQRYGLFLHWIFNWSDTDLARLLHIEENEISGWLQESKDRLFSVFSQKGMSIAEEFESWAAASLQAHWPQPAVSGSTLDAVVATVVNDARQKGKTRQQLDHLREALFIGFAIVSVIAVIWGANNLIPGASVASAPTQAVEAQTTGRKALNLQAETGSSEDSTPTQTPTPDNTFYLVQSGDTLDSIAEKLGTSARLLARVNRLVPGQDLQPGQRLFIPRFRGRPYYLVPPTPVLPQTQPDALSPSSSLTDILQRMQQVGVSFNTLWVDARSIAYGPPGYVGPPRVYRAQVWYSSDQALALGGASETQPDEVILRNEGRLYTSDPNSDSPWYSDLNSSNVVGSHLATNLGTIFNAILEKPGNLPAAGLKVAGKDQVAGRSALILDQMDLSGKRVARLWMDDRTGFVLRQQQFGGLDDRTLLKEVWVTRIAFDVNFPSSLFVPQIPWRGGFANDETGQPLPADATPLALPLALGHEPVVAKSAPAGFNPSHSRLTFQFSQNFDPFANSGQVDLFAGSYRLGRLEFGNPENMVCNRSADGERIAFVSTPSELDWPRPDLRWFSLSDLSNIHTPLPGIAVSQFAFAPDSHQLAGFGAGSVFVLDTDTGSIRHLLLVSDAQSFVWSPDGRYLAMVAVRDPVVGNEAIVIRMSTGEAIYHTPMDVRRGSSTPFWPMKDWGVDFPRDMGGLEACAVPPK